MKAMVLHAFNQPLVQEDVPMPTIGPADILIEVGACGICGTDLKIHGGKIESVPLPHIPGHEVAGEVVEVGPEVKNVRVGARVTVSHYINCGVCDTCRLGRENLCRKFARFGFELPGGMGEYMRVPAVNVFDVGDMPIEQAAILPDAVLTMHAAIVSKGKVQPGETVAILGAGGLGLHGVQLAKLQGARVIAIDIVPEKLAMAKKLGADDLVNSREVDYREAIRELTNGEGVDVMVELVGTPESLPKSLFCLRPGGRMMQVAYSPGKTYPVDSLAVHRNEYQILGLISSRRQGLADVIRLVQEGKLTPMVTRQLPVAQANEGMTMITGPDLLGRIVLRHN